MQICSCEKKEGTISGKAKLNIDLKAAKYWFSSGFVFVNGLSPIRTHIYVFRISYMYFIFYFFRVGNLKGRQFETLEASKDVFYPFFTRFLPVFYPFFYPFFSYPGCGCARIIVSNWRNT